VNDDRRHWDALAARCSDRNALSGSAAMVARAIDAL
jgi:hypothetical protein